MAITISGSGIVEANIADGAVSSDKLATGIDATKLADGTVTSTELQYINTLSSNAQTQISAAGVANIKNGKFDLDLSTATGSLTVTGLGFTPTHILVNWAINNTEIAGWGMMGNAGPYFVVSYDDFNDVYWRAGMEVRVSGSARQAVVLTSLDTDGFTLGNTKHGSPTGTAWVMWMAFG